MATRRRGSKRTKRPSARTRPGRARPVEDEGPFADGAETSVEPSSVDEPPAPDDPSAVPGTAQADDAALPYEPGQGRPAPRGKTQEPECLRLSELVDEDLVRLPLLPSDKWDAVEDLIRLLVTAGELPARLANAALEAAREREAIRPTGWKYGLAFPNGRVPGLRLVTAAVGVSPMGVDFGCRDGLPARIVVFLLFPEARYARYANGIADIAETFDDAGLRERILAARAPAEVVEAIEDAEARRLA